MSRKLGSNSMSEITAITPQKKDKLRCNIEVDGRFYCGMKLETVMQHRLKVGASVTPDFLAQIQLESEKGTALDKALTHISASMKTEREVRAYLARKGYLADVSEYVIGRMKELAFLDDALYARMYVESAGKRKGERIIEMELRRKGVAQEDISAALETLTNKEETAKTVLNKYLRGKELDKNTFRKAYAHLISKGFDYDTARAALQGLQDED